MVVDGMEEEEEVGVDREGVVVVVGVHDGEAAVEVVVVVVEAVVGEVGAEGDGRRWSTDNRAQFL